MKSTVQKVLSLFLVFSMTLGVLVAGPIPTARAADEGLSPEGASPNAATAAGLPPEEASSDAATAAGLSPNAATSAGLTPNAATSAGLSVSGLSLTDFSGRMGEWDAVDYDTANVANTLINLKAFQQKDGADEFLYISVEAEADGFGPNPVIYIDNGGTAAKFQITAWSAPTAAAPNNRITHKIEDGKLYSHTAGTAWTEISSSGMRQAKSSTNDFVEYKIPLSDLGTTTRVMRVGYFNGLNLYLPEAGKPMLVVDPAFTPLDPAHMPQITVDGDPSEWLAQGMTKLATGDRRNSGSSRFDLFGGDLYGLRDGDMLYLLYFGNDNATTGRKFDTRGSTEDGATCIVLNTDADPNTGYTPTFTTMYAGAGADYQIADIKLGKATGTGYDWEDLGDLAADTWVQTDSDFIKCVYGTNGPYVDFGTGDYFTYCCEISIDLAEIQRRGGEPMADIIKLGIFVDGAAYVPATLSTYAPIPCVVDYNFTMQGNKSDWDKIETVALSSRANYRLHMTTDGSMLYTMVSGSSMNTQNIYFISTGATGGYTRNGRANIHYIVANGYLYKTTANLSTTADYVPAASTTRLERINMEYFEDNIMMQLRLNQIGNPDPMNIKVSYYGKNAIDLPPRSGELLALTASFAREKDSDIFYPVESYDKLNNPFRGWSPAIGSSTSFTQPVRMGYQEIRWAAFEPTKGDYNFAGSNTNFKRWKDAGYAINLRFQMDSPGAVGHKDIPQWLYDEMEAYRDGNGAPVPVGQYYNSGGVGAGFAPNYNHPLLLEYHAKLMSAIAAEVADPASPWSAVCNAMAGSLGHWGEFHNWPEEDSGPFPNLSVSNQYIQHYIDAYTGNDNVQIGMRYATPIAAQNNLGLFNDLFGFDGDTKAWVGWFTNGRGEHYKYDDSGRSYEQYLADASNADFWKYSFSGGEFGTSSGFTGIEDSNIMNTLNCSRISHTSWLGPKTLASAGFSSGNPNTATALAQKNIDALYDVMGYRYVVEQFSVITQNGLEANAPVDVEFTVNNKGVAPFYRDWPLEISLINQLGDIVESWIADDVDIRTWLPGRSEVSIPLTLPAVLESGAYKLAIAILDPATDKPGIDFSIMGRRTDGRYTMDVQWARTAVAPSITTGILPDGTVGTAYSESLTADGDTPVTWMIDGGALPDGLDLNADGTISGTPTAASTFNFTVKATNSAGSDTADLSIVISDDAPSGTAPSIRTTSLPDGVAGTAYSESLTADGDAPITWARASGALPDGLTLSPDGVLSGTPIVAGTFAFTVKATNSAGSDTVNLSIVVSGDTSVTPPPLPPPTPRPPSRSKNSSASTATIDRPASTAASAQPAPVSTATATDLTTKAVTEAKANGAEKATVRVKNAGDIALDTMKAMVKTAGSTPVRINADSMANDQSVDTRIRFDPANATRSINIFASTSSAQAAKMKALFGKYYTNKIAVIYFEQQESFGMSVEVAAKVNLTGMDVGNLYFYSFDKAANTYRRILAPAYWVDTNGYLHFTTQYAGTIIASEGALILR